MLRIFPLVAMAGVLFCSLGLTAVAVEAQDAATDQELESTPTEVTDLPTEATELDAEPTESGEEAIDLSLSEEWAPAKGKPHWSKSENPSEFTSDWGPGDSQPPWAKVGAARERLESRVHQGRPDWAGPKMENLGRETNRSMEAHTNRERGMAASGIEKRGKGPKK
jgi:hypothetical protein